MNGGEQAVDDPELLVERLGHRAEAVRRARRVGDQVVLGGVVLLFVDAEHHREVHVLGRGADEHLLRAGIDVRLGLVAIGEEAGRLEDDLNAEIGPGKLGGVLLSVDQDLLTVNDDVLLLEADLTRIAAVVGVVLQEMGKRFRIGEIVDRHHLELTGVALLDCLEDLAANPPKTVNTNSNCHSSTSSHETTHVVRERAHKCPLPICCTAHRAGLRSASLASGTPDAPEGRTPPIRRGEQSPGRASPGRGAPDRSR